jgi:ketosteroid isomerase-like protein
MTNDNSAIARATYDAYVRKDRAAIEALIAEEFRFSSPLDNAINRESYFAICWPNSTNTRGFKFIHMVEHGEQVFVTYVGDSKQSRFRNTEILTIRDGKIAEVEVYFGWNVPHEVPVGEHRDPK